MGNSSCMGRSMCSSNYSGSSNCNSSRSGNNSRRDSRCSCYTSYNTGYCTSPRERASRKRETYDLVA